MTEEHSQSHRSEGTTTPDNQHHMRESANASTGTAASHTSSSGMPFFADVVMDLSEAHDLAETPEAARPQFDAYHITHHRMERIKLPSLAPTPEVTAATETPASLDDLLGHHPQQASNEALDNSTRNRRSQRIRNPTSSSQNGNDNSSSNPTAPRTFSRISNFETDLRTIDLPRSLPRWPRDLPWTVAFFVFVPISLALPILNWKRHDVQSISLAVHPLSTATLHTLWWAAVATFFLSRSLYRTAAGGDGEDARHVVAQALTLAAPISVGVNIALAVVILVSCPRAKVAALIPAWYTVRDVYLFRRWRRRSGQAGSAGTGSRQAFFQALTAMALDILSRSLRRASFYRVLLATLGVQFGVLLLWRWALLAALGQSGAMIILTLVGFKWVTGTISRMLTLLASGGVMAWFAEQSRLAHDVAPVSLQTAATGDGSDHGVAQTDGGDTKSDVEEQQQHITEAYRTVDASVYTSVAEMDAFLDDDYEADDDEFMEAPTRREHSRRGGGTGTATSSSTVKSMLWAGLTISFGSVAQCGLLGGLAQFVWSQVRKVESSQALFSGSGRGGDTGGFQGMPIGINSADATLLAKLWGRINSMARGFVKRYSDLAMCHVAAYYKSYQRAARDVATLVEESGVEPILHDDITTHMCSCVGGAISGIVVLVAGILLLHQRRAYMNPPITDGEVVINMIAGFVLSYTLIFTVMEPLRAAIKAVYVSFAQHPESLSRAFPIIYHRLQRLAQANR